MKYTCPVCGYDELSRAPEDYAICPCCRTEFGASDQFWSHAELRQDWIARGAQWGSGYLPEPCGWSAIEQLRNIGYLCATADLEIIARSTPTPVAA